MAVLELSADLSAWSGEPTRSASEVNDLFAEIFPAFHPTSGAAFETLQILAGDAPHDFAAALAPYAGRASSWESTLESLRDAQADLRRRHLIENHLALAPLTALIEGLAYIPRATPFESTAIKAVTKLLSFQRDILERGILKRQREARTALARQALAKLVNEGNVPYEALFPSGNPGTAKENIERAYDLMVGDFDELDPDIRKEVESTMLKAMFELYEQNDQPAAYDPGTAADAAKDAARCTRAARVVVEQKAKDISISVNASKTVVNLIEKLKRNGRLHSSDIERLRQIGQNVIQATGAAHSVINAAVALGLSENTASDLTKAVEIASNAAMLYIGAQTNPMTAVTAAANLITLFAGKRRKDPAAVRHEAVMNALGAIFEQNQQIMRNQQRMYDAIQQLQRDVIAIQQNQAALIDLGLATIDVAIQNRGLLIRQSTGPVMQLERGLDKYDEMRATQGTSYATLHAFMEGWTVTVTDGFRALEDLFANIDNVHPVLLQSSYLEAPQVALDSQGQVSHFELQASASDQLIRQDEARYSLCKFAWALDAPDDGKPRNPRLLTELATREIEAFSRDGSLTLPLRHQWDGALPPSLLNIGLLWHLGILALRVHAFSQLMSEITGVARLRPKQDIAERPNISSRGRDLLEAVLQHINAAIAQSYLMTGRFTQGRVLGTVGRGLAGRKQRLLNEIDIGEPEFHHDVPAIWTANFDHSNDLTRPVLQDWLRDLESAFHPWDNPKPYYEAHMRALDYEYSMDRYLYTLSSEVWELADEYRRVENTGQDHCIEVMERMFGGAHEISILLDVVASNVDFHVREITEATATLTTGEREFATMAGLLATDSTLILPAIALPSWGDITYNFNQQAHAALAEDFRTLRAAAEEGLDALDVQARLPAAMERLALYKDLPPDSLRPGTEELVRLRAAIAEALAAYDTDAATSAARAELHVGLVLADAETAEDENLV